METPKPKLDPSATPAAEHVIGANELLKSLRHRIGDHPELADAITRLEMALSILSVNTGGQF